MSAMKRAREDTLPRPRLTMTRDHINDGCWWSWACPCGRTMTGQARLDIAYNDAVKHSHTHDAERVLVELNRLAAAALKDAITAIRHNATESSFTYEGVAQGYMIAADIIGTHLVKETP